MKYFFVRPEVPGHLGDRTRADFSVSPPVVEHLHLEFDDWLGGEVLKFSGVPIVIVSESLKQKLEQQSLTGYRISALVTDISFNPQRKLLEMPTLELPKLYLLLVTGVAGSDDFGSKRPYSLVVSERVMSVLETCDLSDAKIMGYPPPRKLDPFRRPYFKVELPLQMEVGLAADRSTIAYEPIRVVDLQWIGSNIYFVSVSLLSTLQQRGATGFSVRESYEFDTTTGEPNQQREFACIEVTGTPFEDSLGKLAGAGTPLIVSEDVRYQLGEFNIPGIAFKRIEED